MSVSQTVVRVENITKVYKLYKQPFDRVKEALSPFKKIYHKKFHALNGVSFELKRGEALGVIGGNGNGKSTLLKIIAQVLTPTGGSVNTSGRVSAILELTSNLKPEMTGRENIVYNLKIQGFTSKKVIKVKTKEIESFAEIGEFIDQPVKVYSSGMKSRLGFGIATSVEPDILILDEVLAVGDFNFQQKCFSKINGMREQISIIFVSHSMNSIRLFCDKVIVIDKGNKIFEGKVDQGIKCYLNQAEEINSKKINSSKFFYGELFENSKKIKNIEIELLNKFNKPIRRINIGEQITIKISFELLYNPKNLIIGIPIWSISGSLITGVSTDMTTFKPVSKNGNKYEIRCTFKNILNPDTYVNVISINDSGESLARIKNENFISINLNSRNFGTVLIDHQWENSVNSVVEKIIKIENMSLNVNKSDKGGLMYDSKSSYEELNSKLYQEIQKKYNPKQVFDIGANYGFIGIVLAKSFCNAKVTLVEASSELCPFIDKNIKYNIDNEYEIINAICAEVNEVEREFSLNPWGSQDNRVKGEHSKWAKETVETISLNKLFHMNKSEFYFIKIDTQGYEEKVFEGAYKYLDNNINWIIKTEFAPYWLKSQGTNATTFLESLITKYNVVEAPMRNRYIGDNLEKIFNNIISKNEIEEFINHTMKHNKNSRGWTDLYIYPKGLNI